MDALLELVPAMSHWFLMATIPVTKAVISKGGNGSL